MYRGWTQTDYQNKHYNINQKWLQHVQRMDTNRLPKQALQYKLKWLQHVQGINHWHFVFQLGHPFTLRNIYQSPSTQLFIVVSDELYRYMFRPLIGRLQAIKTHRIETLTAKLFCVIKLRYWIMFDGTLTWSGTHVFGCIFDLLGYILLRTHIR